MIGRKATRTLAELYDKLFSGFVTMPGAYGRVMPPSYRLRTAELYDYLYERGYDAWFLNLMKSLRTTDSRAVKEFIMRLHTGESIAQSTPTFSWEQRSAQGQVFLRRLAEDILEWAETTRSTQTDPVKDQVAGLLAQLELDGYMFRSGKLQAQEGAVLDVEAEVEVIHGLIREVALDNEKTIVHHLEDSETLYVQGKWDESISSSRKFLEATLREMAARYSITLGEGKIAGAAYERASKVRDWLESHGLIEAQEKVALAEVYALLSKAGSHPYIAERDQARLMRILALTFAQFILLRLGGALRATA